MKLILPLVCLLVAGCAYNRPVLSETISVTSTNGVTTVTERHLTMRSYVLWPASSELAKQKATLGKTMAVGTEGLGQDGGGTNVVDALNALANLIKVLRPTP